MELLGIHMTTGTFIMTCGFAGCIVFFAWLKGKGIR